MQDEIGQDALLLLPEILGAAVGELGWHIIGRLPLDEIEDTTADLVQTHFGHAVAQPLGKGQEGVGLLP